MIRQVNRMLLARRKVNKMMKRKKNPPVGQVPSMMMLTTKIRPRKSSDEDFEVSIKGRIGNEIIYVIFSVFAPCLVFFSFFNSSNRYSIHITHERCSRTPLFFELNSVLRLDSGFFFLLFSFVFLF